MKLKIILKDLNIHLLDECHFTSDFISTYDTTWLNNRILTTATLHCASGKVDLGFSAAWTALCNWKGEQGAGGWTPMKPKRKPRMWWREQMAASDSSLFVWLFFFFLLLPPVPAASLTAWPPLEKHKQLETIDWARASQNISGTWKQNTGRALPHLCTVAELKVNYFSDTRLKLINYEYINSKLSIVRKY